MRNRNDYLHREHAFAWRALFCLKMAAVMKAASLAGVGPALAVKRACRDILPSADLIAFSSANAQAAPASAQRFDTYSLAAG